jgi:hypothetical protein
VRGIANSSGTFPTNTLYLAQANPDAIVNPADYFRQLGESLPAMQAANVHIQERIQQVRDDPPTMEQDVTIVPDGRGFEPYVCMFVGEGASSDESRSMGDYSARFNPQSVSQAAMRGSARLIGTTLVLPCNHVPHSSLGSEQEDDLDETLYGIPRDLAPYRQTVSGTNTLTIQTLETSRSLRNQIDQLTAVADALDETYALLNSLQATSQKMAEARPSPEYTRAVYRWRRWFTQYQEFLRKPLGTP